MRAPLILSCTPNSTHTLHAAPPSTPSLDSLLLDFFCINLPVAFYSNCETTAAIVANSTLTTLTPTAVASLLLELKLILPTYTAG